MDSALEDGESFKRRRDWSLPGDAAWWMFLTAEFLTLFAFFVVYAFMRRANLEEFQAAQALLDPRFALVNSLVLITSGYCVARGVRALRCGGSERSRSWVLAAAALGVVFIAIKGAEYAEKFGLGLTLSSGTFWFFYYFLTGFHFLHVLLGIGFLVWVGLSAPKKSNALAFHVQAESCAAFWHMLDLVWILLFPLLYLL
jgi:nitric oxide reductase NorE protein